MEHSLTILLSFILSPLLVPAQSGCKLSCLNERLMDRILKFCIDGTGPIYSNITRAVETSIVSGTSGSITEVETFLPTIYPGFASLTSTIYTATIITLTDGTSTGVSTYSYEIGPGGVGWIIPTPSNGAPVLAQPPYLPGSSSTAGSSTTGSSTGGSSILSTACSFVAIVFPSSLQSITGSGT